MGIPRGTVDAEGDATGAPAEPDPDGLIQRSAGRRRRRRTALGSAALAVTLAGAGVLTGVNLAGAGSTGQASSPPVWSPVRRPTGSVVAPGASASNLPAIGVPFTYLFTRTSASGVTIRAYTEGQDANPTCGSTEPCPPVGTTPGPIPCPRGAMCAQPMVDPSATECGQLVVELSTDKAVAIGSAPWPTNVRPAPDVVAVIGSGSFGVAEGGPVSWVAVWAGAAVADVQLSSGTTVTDGMAPSSGIAVVAQSGSGGLSGADVVGKDEGGATVATVPAEQASGGSTCAAPAPSPTTTTSTTTTSTTTPSPVSTDPGPATTSTTTSPPVPSTTTVPPNTLPPFGPTG